MTDETGSTGGEAITVITADSGTPAELTMNHAAKALADIREKRSKESSAESADTATAATELSGEDNAAPLDEVTGETQEVTPAEKPLRELPRSWTKDRAEIWNNLDPAAQDILLEQDRTASAEVRRVQNEAAAERKAAQAERETAEKARQQYEAKLPALMQALHESSPFADIKSMADVEKLQAEDPFRFQQFQVYQWKMQGAQAELQEAETRKATETQTKWNEHVQAESTKFSEGLSEADKSKLKDLMAEAPKFLQDRGFTQEELNGFASGRDRLSIYDHRVQSLILDGMKYRDIQKAPKAVATAPIPPVVRPGTSKPSGSAVSERAQALDKNLTSTGSLRAAQELRSAQLAARSRRPSA